MATERIQKVLAAAGIASRRKAEQLVAEGRVSVNGEVVRTPGTKVDPRRDKILVDGTAIARRRAQEHIYIILHKPRAVISSTDDDRGRPTVIDLVPEFAGKRLVLAGRLDYHSEGLVLLTDDGDLVYDLTHPRHGTPKVYQVKVKGDPSEAKLDKLRKGVHLEDGPTKPAHVEKLGLARSNTWVEITLTEGRNRQVRRMFDLIGHRVQRLVRVGLAGLSIEGLDVGESRMLSEAEVAAMKSGETPARPARSKRKKKIIASDLRPDPRKRSPDRTKPPSGGKKPSSDDKKSPQGYKKSSQGYKKASPGYKKPSRKYKKSSPGDKKSSQGYKKSSPGDTKPSIRKPSGGKARGESRRASARSPQRR